MNKTKTIKEELENLSAEQEEQLASNLQLISMLRENPDILQRHPELLAVIDVPHQSGSAVSLIERQVSVLRDQLKTQEDRLRELMDVARDNERLAQSRHQLAINLLSAQDLDDVVNTVLDVMSNELGAEFAEIKLFTSDEERLTQKADLFIDEKVTALTVFKTMLQQKNTICGKATEQQKSFMFGNSAAEIKSAAIVPLVSGANLGLIGLGSTDSERFSTNKSTDFLSQMGELISAALAMQLEK